MEADGREMLAEDLDRTLAEVDALALQLDARCVLGATGDVDSGSSLATELDGLIEHYRRGSRVASGVLRLPGHLGIGDQTGLLPITLGDADFPLRSGQLRVAGEGTLQGLVQRQGRRVRKAGTGQQQDAAGSFFQA